ncbi:Dyp-type peroxidase [Grimontia marina]|uniref:Putative deferrochelatase/peroxidase YfeX n=1 Tax=Grimontia marina TaxID=646534 RepID=A0A128F8I8_9GAMM|nr:Dyp-type peroxidase [Grimontia marina]CZF83127.1 putative deferrochelatase/peroxidase YfeX [Grimontia marina]
MAVSQPAIVADAGPFALYTVLKVNGSASDVLAQCRALHSLVDDINALQPDADLKAAVSFSSAFCAENGIATPTEFSAFRPLGEGDAHAPATKCDIFLHAHSTRHDLNFFLLRKFLSPIASEVEVVDETYGYRYLDSRDMTEFIDGTENPEGEEARRDVAIIADGECAGGSVVMMQRYVHKLAAWEPLTIKQQEKVIGRTKPDSIELEDVPPTSHVGRVDIKEDGKGLKMVRHSLPYGSVSGDHGLLFLAYCHTQHVHKTMLESMFGERDGKTDMLLRFTTPVTGAYFYAPSMDVLKRI